MESGAFITLTRTPPLPIGRDRDRERLVRYRLIGAAVLGGIVVAFGVAFALGLATQPSGSVARLAPLARGVDDSRLAVSGIASVPAIPGLRVPPKTVKRAHVSHSAALAGAGSRATVSPATSVSARVSTPASVRSSVSTPAPVRTAPVAVAPRPSAPSTSARGAGGGSISSGTAGGGSSSAGTVSGRG